MPSKLPSSLFVLLLLAAFSGLLPAQQVENEEVLFYGETLGGEFGTRIYNLEKNQARWWFKLVTGARVSPDGREVAYLFNLGGVHIADLNGQNGRNVYPTSTAGNLFWSSDGQRIAFLERVTNDQPPPGLKWVITIISREGEHLKSIDLNMTPQGGYAWSPDDKYFAVAGKSTNPDHYICTINGIPCPPGSETINDSIFLIDVETGELQPLIKALSSKYAATGSDNTRYLNPIWSPDSENIAAFESKWGGDETTAYYENNLVVIPLDSRTPSKVIAARTSGPQGGSLAQPPQRSPRAWSLDGTEIVYNESQLGQDAEPGMHITNLAGQSRKISDGFFGHTEWTILNPGPKLEIKILPDEPTYGISENLEIQFKVTHRGEDPATYTFPDELFTQDPEPEDDTDSIVLFGEPEELEPFVLSEDDPERIFSIPAETVKPGVLKLASSVNAQPLEGDSYNLEAEAKILVNPLAVKVTITNEEHLLNQTPEKDWSDLAQELNAARRESELEPYQNLIEIQLEIKNAGKDTLENVSVPDALNILSLIKSTDVESPGVPLDPILLVTPAESDNRIDLTTPDPEVSIPDFTLEEDETKTFTWLLEAKDANPDPESDDSADLELKALILASLQDETIQSLATEEFAVIEKVLLKWGIKPRDGRKSYVSGQSVWVDAYIENVSKEAGFPKDLLVMVFQTPKDNVGGGYLVEAGQNLAANRPQDDPDSYQFFVLPSDEDTRLDLQAFYRTLETREPSQGHIEYDVRLWTIAEDDSLSNADAQAHLNEDDGWIREYEVTLAPNYLSDRSKLLEECLESGEFPWLCGMSEGIYNKFGPGLVDLAAYGIELAKKSGNYSLLMVSETCQAMVDLWKGIQGDEEAMAAFIQDVYDYYAGLVHLGAIPYELGTKAPMPLKQFGDMAVESFADFMFKIETGDAQERQLVIGEFLGANPDLLLEPLVALRGFRNMRLAMHEMADGVSDNYIAAAQRQRVDKNLATTATRVEEAFSAGEDAAKALRAGDLLTDNMMLRIYGITKKQLKDLQDIAEQFKIVLTFRSRNPLSVEWLEKGLARVKPQALKHKTVNDIDVEYLGYPEDAKATLAIVEPPKELQALAKDDVALRNAIDIYVDELAKINPKLADDDVLRYEVADRLKTRVEEWDELVPKNAETGEVLETYEISVAFDAQAQFASKAGKTVKVDDVRTVQQKAIEPYVHPVTGETLRRFELKTTGPPSEGEGASIFKAITGDIDFLAILEPNGMMITDAKRRVEIYEALAGVIDMQHGESFTLFLQKAREKYLRCCVAGAPDAEAMVAIGPGKRKTPRAAYFVDNMSLMREGPNTRFLGAQKKLRDRYFRVVRKKGEPIKIRREDVSGEFLLLDGYPQSLAVKRNFISYFQPKIYRQLLEEWAQRFVFFSPTYVARVMNGNESETQSWPIQQSDPVTIRADDGAIYTVDGPILQIDEMVDLEALRLWTEDESWQPIEQATAFALGDPEAADMAPMTVLSEYTVAGNQELQVLNLTELEATGRFFESGDRVVIDPGQPQEEYAVVAFTEPFTLTGPLVFDHDTGAMVAFLEADVVDSDGDNLSDSEEAQLGTSPTLADTDGDGLNDNQELAYGTNPNDSDSRFEFADVLLGDESGNILLSWQGTTDKTYTVEGSYDLNVWFELDTIQATQHGPMEMAISFAPEEGVSRFIRLRLGQ